MERKRKIYIASMHILLTAIPFVMIYIISPHIQYENYEFLYLVSHRKFWYIWLIPLLFIIVKKYRRAHIFTICTTVAMFMAQYSGDIRYRQELIKAQQGNYYPYANHFGLWLKYTFELSAACLIFYCVKNRKQISDNINKFTGWWNCR